MNYEKKYKDALERARNIRFGNPNSATANVVCEEIFPELKEREDERIRKDIISYLQHESQVKRFIGDIEYDKWIAWLEKQGEKESVDYEEVKKCRENPHASTEELDACINWLKSIKNRVGCEVNCTTTKEWSEENSDNHIVENNEMVKPINKVKPKFDSSDWIISDMSVETVKPTYKVELRFKVGDWVVYGKDHRSIYQVEKIKNGYYVLRHILGGTFEACVLHDENIKLWDINKDVKDGDVLSDGQMTVIFKHFEDSSNRQYIIAHIGLDRCGKIQISDGNWGLCIDKTKPATFEQRDLLFQEMKKEGYEWDANKRELKKINN